MKNHKTIKTIILSSVLTTSTIFATEIKKQELTEKQLQICINKVEELVKKREILKKTRSQIFQFSDEMESFRKSIKAIDKYIEAYKNNYKDLSQELIYKEFELEEYNKDTPEYNLIKKSIAMLENKIEKHTSTKYFKGLITTKQTLSKLSENGQDYNIKNFEKVYQDEKKIEIEQEKIIEECVTNKIMNPEIIKKICEKNKNSIFCNKLQK